jgi:hypothetical protein
MAKSSQRLGGADPIRQLQQSYDQRLRREERRDRLESRLYFAFWWFWISFMSLGTYELVFSDGRTPMNLRSALEAIGAAVFGGLGTWVWFPVAKKIARSY